MPMPPHSVSRPLVGIGLLTALVVAALTQIERPTPTPVSPSAPTAPSTALGTISGRVTRDGGLPAAGFTVRAIPAALPGLRYVRDNPNTVATDADGRYTLTLRPPGLPLTRI